MPRTVKVGTTDKIINASHLTFKERESQLDFERKENEDRAKKEKQSHYKSWYQFNRDHSEEMMWLASNHPRAQTILLFLLHKMDEYNAVMCSHQVIAEALNISVRTIARNVSILREKGFIAVLKSGTSNVYVVNDDLAWSSWGNNKKYCKFPANVVLSASENEDYFKDIRSAKFKQLKIDNE